MSKSLGNAIAMRDAPEVVEDEGAHHADRPAAGAPQPMPATRRAARSGRCTRSTPTKATRADWSSGCKTAGIGCLDCKQPLIEAIQREQAPWRERANDYLANPKQVHWIVEVGAERARAVARKTLREVRSAMGLAY